jgi:hypothetical protein
VCHGAHEEELRDGLAEEDLVEVPCRATGPPASCRAAASPSRRLSLTAPPAGAAPSPLDLKEEREKARFK